MSSFQKSHFITLLLIFLIYSITCLGAMHHNVEKTYKKLSQIEHVLLRPDMYIGPTSVSQEQMWILQDNEFVNKKINYVAGLYKIFDEILVNAADNFQRDRKMTKIEVTITDKNISILNDGKSIPVQIHKDHKMYVPELIFGHLLTSSNYQDSEKKITGGRNGYGAKLTNIFSKNFQAQIADSTNKKLMTISWQDNMTIMKQPEITPYQGKDYTKITFSPDFSKFGMSKMTLDMLSLLKKRVYDLSGILKVKVYLNSLLVPVMNFRDYANMFISNPNQLITDQDENSERWQVYVAKSEGQFNQISFVNSICTSKGGTHVNHIVDQIVDKLVANLARKAKDLSIKPFHVKPHLKVFINCLIQNPCFDSQTKETLTLQVSKFGSKYTVSDQLVKELIKTGVGERILHQVRSKENSKIDKQLKKIKNNRLLIPKLEDANMAGRAENCTLILTEGDSAKALAMQGIEELGRDYYGVYPLKGKVMNVKEMTPKQAMDNLQLSNIVKILGLSFGQIYNHTKNLRYSSVMIMADQDADGSHIKGLVINFFQSFWPDLCKVTGFLRQFVTPIIKCAKGNTKIDFFSQTDYEAWKGTVEDDWTHKYYKGLGTSTSKEAKEYFTNLKKHQIKFRYEDERDQQALELAFGKKNADARKRWLEEYDHTINIDYNIKEIKIQDFVQKELIHFSISDNSRSIPSVVDGLKPSQRKILYACFKRNLQMEIKVAQLAGYVAEHSAYHHGENSLCGAIVSMAQNFVGSNNLNLLEPIGQFGTRYMNGKDSASARYIYTKLNVLTRYLFNEADDHVVEYLEDEGMSIQPRYYVPIVPLVLINGAEGIGTGWSTCVNPHKVKDVINLVRERINKRYKLIHVGWERFEGEVTLDQKNSYLVTGSLQVQGDAVVITEIPTNKSIRDYKTFLEEKVASIENKDPDLEDIREYHEGDKIHFQITFLQGKQPVHDQIQKYLKLTTSLQQNNMHLFTADEKINKFQTISDILEEFYKERIRAYTRRKDYLISRFMREEEILNAKVQFIQAVISGEFKMMEKKDSWIKKLNECKFKKYNQFTKTISTKKSQYQENLETNKEFNYLLTLPIWSFCQEKIEELNATKKEITAILNYYQRIEQTQLWLKDLNQFENAWDKSQLGEDVKRYKPTSSKNSKNHSVEKKITSKRQKLTDQGNESESEEITVVRKKANNKNLMQEEIQRSVKPAMEQNRRKNKRTNIEVPVDFIESMELELHQKPKQTSAIDQIIAKYMKPAAGTSGSMSLEERIRARISKGDENFEASYKEAKQNKEVKNEPKANKIQEDFDWLQ